MSTAENKARIEVITNELEELNQKVIALEAERKDLMKSVKSAIRKELNETAKKYGLVVVNSKSKKQKDTTEAESE